eukprot:5115823-Pleurochrysis_carterae.AAC.6
MPMASFKSTLLSKQRDLASARKEKQFHRSRLAGHHVPEDGTTTIWKEKEILSAAVKVDAPSADAAGLVNGVRCAIARRGYALACVAYARTLVCGSTGAFVHECVDGRV